MQSLILSCIFKMKDFMTLFQSSNTFFTELHFLGPQILDINETLEVVNDYKDTKTK